jgi:hypothetical protein
MSKELSDILGRLNGDMMALNGMASKYEQQQAASNPTFEQQQQAAASPPPPLTKATLEDYKYTQKLLDEIQTLAKSASDEIDKALKVPPPPSAESEASAPAPSSGSGSSKTK